MTFFQKEFLSTSGITNSSPGRRFFRKVSGIIVFRNVSGNGFPLRTFSPLHYLLGARSNSHMFGIPYVWNGLDYEQPY